MKKTNGTELANIVVGMYKHEKHIRMDFKNIQRRVYDAINVFCALGMVEKKRNTVVYLGPTELATSSNPEAEVSSVRSLNPQMPQASETSERIREKRERLRRLLLQVAG